MEFDDVCFSVWCAWRYREKAEWDDMMPTDYGLAGVYLLAHFPPGEAVSESEPRHLDPHFIYIGQQATVIAAAQSFTSFLSPFGADKAKVYALNLRNRVAFRAADLDGAKEMADFIGQRTVTKRSWGSSHGRTTSNYHRTEEFKIKPHQLMELSDGQAVIVHCSKRWRKMRIPPKLGRQCGI